MAFTMYNSGLLDLTSGALAFATEGVYAVLLGGAYTPALTHVTLADIVANEVADADYAPVDLTTKDVSLNGSQVEFDSDDIDFGAAVSISARYLALIQGTVAAKANTDRLVGYEDFGSVLSSTNAQFIVRTTNKIYQIAPV